MSVDSKMTAIADAIRGKTGGTDELTLDAMAQAIAALEVGGGNVITGTITPSGEDNVIEINLADYGYVYDSALGWPKMRFFFETGISYSDKTHTTSRHVMCMQNENTSSVPISNSAGFVSLSAYATSGSYSLSANITNVANMWSVATDPLGSSAYNAMNGYGSVSTDGTCRIFIKLSVGTSYGLIAGRTYVWGVLQ